MSTISVEGSQSCDTINYLKTILVLILLPFPFTVEAVLPVPISQNLQAVSVKPRSSLSYRFFIQCHAIPKFQPHIMF